MKFNFGPLRDAATENSSGGGGGDLDSAIMDILTGEESTETGDSDTDDSDGAEGQTDARTALAKLMQEDDEEEDDGKDSDGDGRTGEGDDEAGEEGSGEKDESKSKDGSEDLDEELEDDRDPEPKSDPKTGKKVWTFPEARGRKIYDGYKFANEVRDIAPSLEDVKTHHSAYVNQERMHQDFESGDPQAINEFLGYWNSVNPRAMEVAAEVMIKGLPQANPQAFGRARSLILDDLISELRNAEASYEAESQDAQRYKFAAEMLEYHLSKAGDRMTRTQQTKRDVDPRTEQLEREREQLLRERAERANAERQNFVQDTNRRIQTKVAKEIDQSLQKLAPLKASNEKAYNRAVRDLRQELAESMRAAGEWKQTFELSYEKAIRSGDPKEQQKLVDRYLSQVRLKLPRLSASIIRDFTNDYLRKVDQRTTKQEKAATKTQDMSAGGAASNPKVPGSKSYEKATTVEEKLSILLGVDAR